MQRIHWQCGCTNLGGRRGAQDGKRGLDEDVGGGIGTTRRRGGGEG